MVLHLALSDEDGAKLRRLAEALAKTNPDYNPASVEAAAHTALQLGLDDLLKLHEQLAREVRAGEGFNHGD